MLITDVTSSFSPHFCLLNNRITKKRVNDTREMKQHFLTISLRSPYRQQTQPHLYTPLQQGAALPVGHSALTMCPWRNRCTDIHNTDGEQRRETEACNVVTTFPHPQSQKTFIGWELNTHCRRAEAQKPPEHSKMWRK